MRRSILFYTYALTGGGAERVWALLSSGFAARGWDVTLALDYDAPENRSFVDSRVQVHVLGRHHAASTARLAELLFAKKPDISISAMSASNLKHTIAASVALRLRHAILSYHGYSTTEPQALSKLGYLGIPAMTRATAATVCVSDGLKDHVVERWGGDARKVERIYNPASIGATKHEVDRNDLIARGPVVLASGRLVSYKNFSLLLRAFARVEPKSARLILLGEGPERPALIAEIARLGLTDRVSMPGYVPEPWNWYREASCFVSSSDQEPFGLVIVEALAHGLPVVSTACDGPREILTDAQWGRVIPCGDEAAMAQAITQALADPGDPERRIARAEDFSLAHAVDNYEELFDRVLTTNRKRMFVPNFPDAKPELQLAEATSAVSSSTLPASATPAADVASGFAPAVAPDFMPDAVPGPLPGPLPGDVPDAYPGFVARRKRTLLFYTHALAGGGAERVWALLASGFARGGDNVVLALDYEAQANVSYVDPAVRVVILEGNHLRNVMRLRKLIADENPDVVLSALCASNLKAFVAALLTRTLRRTVVSYHGFFGSEAKMLSILSYLSTPLLTRATAATVAVSDSLKDDLISVWRGDARRVRRIYNPTVWGSAPALTSAELAARPPLALAVGRLEKHKNFDRLLRAFAQVEPRDARLIIIGEGPESSRLAQLIDDLGLTGRVELAGYRAQPWSYYAQAKCLAVASESEAFGLVVAEALAHGLAVVSTDCKGPREILAGGEYGALVPVGDIDAMAAAISKALADPGDPAPRMARACDFSVDRALEAYSALMDERIPENDADRKVPLVASDSNAEGAV